MIVAARDTSRSVLPVAASVRCAALLEGPEQPLDILGVMPAAVYLVTRGVPSQVISVLARDAVRHPAALVIPDDILQAPFLTVDRNATVTVGEGRLVLPRSDGDRELQVVRWYDPVPRITSPGRDRLERAAGILGEVLAGSPQAISPSRDAATSALDALEDAVLSDDPDRAVAGVLALIGTGPGLTPSGDDMLAGLLATLVAFPAAPGSERSLFALRGAVSEHARARTTALSAELLRHAIDGAVALPVERLLREIAARRVGDCSPERHRCEDRMRDAAHAVRRIGASSGEDLLAGIMTALHVATRSGASRTASVGASRGGYRGARHCERGLR